MGSKPTSKCVKVIYTIVPNLWVDCNNPLSCLRIFFFSVGKDNSGLDFSSKIIVTKRNPYGVETHR